MIIVKCPHCDCIVLIEQVNCKIFRHGSLKTTGEQIPPHATQAECERLVSEDKIWGCGKPFFLVMGSNGDWVATVCEYI